jgi:hypothetical protein
VNLQNFLKGGLGPKIWLKIVIKWGKNPERFEPHHFGSANEL